MSDKTNAQVLRECIAKQVWSDSERQVLDLLAGQLESNAKRYEDSCKLQDIGRCAAASIVEMVEALECDYDRLEELRGHRDTLREEFDDLPANAGVDFANWVRNQDLMTSEDVDELAALEAAAGECTSREEAEQRIHEDALSVEVRSAWHTPGDIDSSGPVEFMLLLGTGGPAVRIIGELTDLEPSRAWLEVQDWGTPWTRYFDIEQDTLLTYARCFYFGEG